MSEEEAVNLAKLGDSFAFEVLYTLHYQKVLSHCRRQIRNSNDAEDVTQEVFLAVYRNLPKYEGRSSFATWLHRITLNAISSHCRQNHVKKKIEAVIPEVFVAPSQHTSLEINEAFSRLTDMEKFCVQAHVEGHSVRNLGGEAYYKSAQRRLKRL